MKTTLSQRMCPIKSLSVFLLAGFICSAVSMGDDDFEAAVRKRIEVSPNNYPYTVAVIRNRNRYSLCAGALIGDEWVVTTANCVDMTEVTLAFGVLDLDVSDNLQKRVDIPFKNIFIHEGYDPQSFENNLALIRLPEKIKSTHYISTIQLATKDDGLFIGEKGILTGWNDKRKMFAMDLNIPSNRNCRSVFLSVNNKEMCGFEPTVFFGFLSKKFVVHMGSPLMVPKYRKVVGLLSRSSWVLGSPFVFVRLSDYFEWIQKKINSSTKAIAAATTSQPATDQKNVAEDESKTPALETNPMVKPVDTPALENDASKDPSDDSNTTGISEGNESFVKETTRMQTKPPELVIEVNETSPTTEDGGQTETVTLQTQSTTTEMTATSETS